MLFAENHGGTRGKHDTSLGHVVNPATQHPPYTYLLLATTTMHLHAWT